MLVIMRLPETCNERQKIELERLLADKRSSGYQRSWGSRRHGNGDGEGVQEEARLSPPEPVLLTPYRFQVYVHPHSIVLVIKGAYFSCIL